LLDLKVNVTVVVPTVENAIDSRSYKLGDVYTSYSGQTVEINNTDAEGRLILADALSYVVKNLEPSYVIDLATLTGNVVLALGEQMAGFCANDDALANSLMDASAKTSDLLWRLPLFHEYKDAFKSDIADMVNSGGRDAGSIKAALFLHEFIGSAKWAHIDIAGAAYWSKPKYYHPTKATGYGVRLLVEFLKKR
jgi:leucyl aminopeptidase